MPGLQGHIDPSYRAFDMDYPDQKRADRFLEELARFEKEGDMPRLSIVHLPGDHTAGTRIGKRTPTACVADNDLALGRIMARLSTSPFWKDMVVFIVEDDAQNGPDHVEAHRSVALVLGPYVLRGKVDSTLYSTTSMVRTIELILGLEPMSQFDAAARPMYACFQSEPDLRAYEPVRPAVDMEEKNTAHAWGAHLSEKLDLSRADAADDQILNAMIWHSVRGAQVALPPPVRSAFFYPQSKERGEVDDDE
jgi:hypothetical protein